MLRPSEKHFYITSLLALETQQLLNMIDEAIYTKVELKHQRNEAVATDNKTLEENLNVSLSVLEERLIIAQTIQKCYQVLDKRRMVLTKNTLAIHNSSFFMCQASYRKNGLRFFIIFCYDDVIEIPASMYNVVQEYVKAYDFED